LSGLGGGGGQSIGNQPSQLSRPPGGHSLRWRAHTHNARRCLLAAIILFCLFGKKCINTKETKLQQDKKAAADRKAKKEAREAAIARGSVVSFDLDEGADSDDVEESGALYGEESACSYPWLPLANGGRANGHVWATMVARPPTEPTTRVRWRCDIKHTQPREAA